MGEAALTFRPDQQTIEHMAAARLVAAGIDWDSWQIDDWASIGAVAQRHKVRVPAVTPTRLHSLLALADTLVGVECGAAVIIEVAVEDEGDGAATLVLMVVE